MLLYLFYELGLKIRGTKCMSDCICFPQQGVILTTGLKKLYIIPCLRRKISTYVEATFK